MKDLKSLELELANLKIVLEKAISDGSAEMEERLRNEIKNIEKLMENHKNPAS